MHRYKLKWLAVCFAVGGMLVSPAHLRAAEAISQRQMNAALSIDDVALGQNNSFHGTVMDSNGTPIAGSQVIITRQGQEVARTTTNDRGRFAFQQLQGGLHLVHADEGAALYRFWAEGTAPPAAKPHVTLVNETVTRGQRPFRDLFFSNGFIMTAIVAAAIAIPLAVHDARKSGS
jgi:hypothetical protein